MRAKRLQFLDQRPWSLGGVGAAKKHFIDRILVRLPFFPVSPILVVQLPLLSGILLPDLEAFELLLLIDVNPEFSHHRSKKCLKFSSISLISRWACFHSASNRTLQPVRPEPAHTTTGRKWLHARLWGIPSKNARGNGEPFPNHWERKPGSPRTPGDPSAQSADECFPPLPAASQPS